MAAIDKIYLNTKKEYEQFKEWCSKQPPLFDKYGVKTSLINYVYQYDDFKGGPVFMAPYYLDAYLIKNCPFDFVQEELKLNYGYWSQNRVKEAYNVVKNRKNVVEGEPYWYMKLSDFKINGDRIEYLPNKNSSYIAIKENKLYNTPFTSIQYTIGKHCKCVKHPLYYYNRPYKQKSWDISIVLPFDMCMWYHGNHNSWDFANEFVISDWSCSHSNVKTIKALKRNIIKWKLPIGTKVYARGRYIQDDYEFIVTK